MSFKDLSNPSATPAQIVGASTPRASDPTKMLIDYNDKFQTATPISFRDDIILQTMSILISTKKPNALLIGAAGSGKTAIAEDISRRIATNDPSVPPQLQNAHVFELPLSNIIAGSGVVGQLEQKTQSIIDFATNTDNNVILFIDEIHLLLSHNQTYGCVAQILKPALARGDLRIIGATTLQEANDLTHDPALSRRFSRVIVDELTPEQTTTIIRHAFTNLSKHYNNKLSITDETIDACVRIADDNLSTYTHRPDNALTLLDRCAADVFLTHTRQINQAKLDNNTQLLNILSANSTIPITSSALENCALKLTTGHARVNKVNFDDLADSLSEIKGQVEPIRKITKLLKVRQSSIFPKRKPLTLLLSGASGVGKTQLARIVARELTNTSPIILNMTEYNDAATVNRIIGAPAGYVGYNSHTELPFDILESNPYQVIILDEFEKCHRSVQRLFMSVFDEGTLKYANGKSIDFTKSVIFATTNAGVQQTSHIGFSTQSASSVDISALSEYFDVEFLNRFKAIINFNEISKETYADILENKYETVLKTYSCDRHIAALPEHLPQTDLERLVDETYNRAFGARPANRTIQDYIDTLVSN